MDPKRMASLHHRLVRRQVSPRAILPGRHVGTGSPSRYAAIMRSPMQHRHLTGDCIDLPVIADIIGRGTLQDWIGLRDALRHEPDLRPKILSVCEAYLSMEETDFREDFSFWKSYCQTSRTTP